jgi:lysozyme family protein
VSDDFLRWLAFMEREEGGWSDDPTDAGGATKYGISSRAHPTVDLATLTREQAREIAKRDYWDVVRGDELGWPLNCVLADGAFHSGAPRAVGWLQTELGVAVDGKLGEETMARAWKIANEIGAQRLAEQVHLRRVKHLYLLVRSKPDQLKFIGGWWNRTVRLAYLMAG